VKFNNHPYARAEWGCTPLDRGLYGTPKRYFKRSDEKEGDYTSRPLARYFTEPLGIVGESIRLDRFDIPIERACAEIKKNIVDAYLRAANVDS